MNNIQKNFKAKAKRGLRMAAGGILDPLNTGEAEREQAEQFHANQFAAIRDYAMEGGNDQIDSIMGNRGLSQRQKMRNVVGVQGLVAGAGGAPVAPDIRGLSQRQRSSYETSTFASGLHAAQANARATPFQKPPLPAPTPELTHQQDIDARENRIADYRQQIDTGKYRTPQLPNMVQLAQVGGIFSKKPVAPEPVRDHLTPAQRAEMNRLLPQAAPTGNVTPSSNTPSPSSDTVDPSIGGVVRNIEARHNMLRNMKDGGFVPEPEPEMYEVEGKGGPTDDAIPTLLAGNRVNVSDGEKVVVLPAKTAQSPAAVSKIEDIIEATNGKRTLRDTSAPPHSPIYASKGGFIPEFIRRKPVITQLAPEQVANNYTDIKPNPVEPTPESGGKVALQNIAAQKNLPSTAERISAMNNPPGSDPTHFGPRETPPAVTYDVPAPQAEIEARVAELKAQEAARAAARPAPNVGIEARAAAQPAPAPDMIGPIDTTPKDVPDTTPKDVPDTTSKASQGKLLPNGQRLPGAPPPPQPYTGETKTAEAMRAERTGAAGHTYREEVVARRAADRAAAAAGKGGTAAAPATSAPPADMVGPIDTTPKAAATPPAPTAPAPAAPEGKQSIKDRIVNSVKNRFGKSTNPVTPIVEPPAAAGTYGKDGSFERVGTGTAPHETRTGVGKGPGEGLLKDMSTADADAKLAKEGKSNAGAHAEGAKTYGQAYGKEGMRGVGKQLLRDTFKSARTPVGRGLSAAGVTLQVGDHWDALAADKGWDFGPGDKSGITPMEKAQLLAGDAAILTGTAVGTAGGAALGAPTGFLASAPLAVGGAIGGGIFADKALTAGREAVNWGAEQLGAEPNFIPSREEIIERSRKHQADIGYKESGIQKGARGANEAIGNVLEKTGLITRPEKPAAPMTDEEYAKFTAPPTAEELEKWNPGAAAANAKANKEAVTRNPLYDPASGKITDESNPNIQALRKVGINSSLEGNQAWGSGPETGNHVAFKDDGLGRMHMTTPNEGIRTIQTKHGNTYAARDKNGQLHVVANLDKDTNFHSLAQAVEGQRMTADMARQKRTFAEMEAQRNIKSKNPGDRPVGVAQMLAMQHNDKVKSDQEQVRVMEEANRLTLQGKLAAARTTQAEFMRTMAKDNEESILKHIDNVYGKDDKDNPQLEDRRNVVKRLYTMANRDGIKLGQLDPRRIDDILSFTESANAAKPGSLMGFLQNVAGTPYTEMEDPVAQVKPMGPLTSTGHYLTAGGNYVHINDVLGGNMFTGGQNAHLKAQLMAEFAKFSKGQ